MKYDGWQGCHGTSLRRGRVAPPTLRARDTLALQAVQSSIVDAVTVHQVHSPEFVIDGDEARVVWAAQERVKWNNGGGSTAFGHYHEWWVRRDGRWQIAELRLTHLPIDLDSSQES